MNHRGISHIDLSTLEMDETREFCEGVLKRAGSGDTSFSISGAIN
jgi:hypothetical protein